MGTETLGRLFGMEQQDRIPVIPDIGKFCARIRNTSFSSISRDPTAFSNAAMDINNSFLFDGVICCEDTTLEAEALGCTIAWTDDGITASVSSPAPGPLNEMDLEKRTSGTRLGSVVETVRRVAKRFGTRTATVAAVTGPATLASKLTGTDIFSGIESGPDQALQALEISANACVSLTKNYCEGSVHSVVVVEEGFVSAYSEDVLNEIRNSMQPLLNVLEYYRKDAILHFPSCRDIGNVKGLLAPGIRGVVIGKGADHKKGYTEAVEKGIAYGAPLLESMEAMGTEEISGREGFFVTGGIQYNADANMLSEFLKHCR